MTFAILDFNDYWKSKSENATVLLSEATGAAAQLYIGKFFEVLWGNEKLQFWKRRETKHAVNSKEKNKSCAEC